MLDHLNLGRIAVIRFIAVLHDGHSAPSCRPHLGFRLPWQTVVVIGSSASAVDISRDISEFAREVHVASRSLAGGAPARQPGYDNLWLHTMVITLLWRAPSGFSDGILGRWTRYLLRFLHGPCR